MTKYKLAIFDLAGTTVYDTNTVGSCLQTALKKVGVDASVDDVNSVMGIPKPISIETLLDKYGQEGDIEAIHQDFRNLMMDTYKTSDQVKEIPGTTETFQALRDAGIQVAVDTGFDREITDILLSRLNWGALLTDSITSDEVENGRPHPEMILELCRRAEVSPADVIKVGDTPADLMEGKAAGVGLNVGVLYGTHNESQLSPYGPDALLSDIRDLIKLIA